MNVTEKIEKVIGDAVGATFTAKEIVQLVMAAFPDTNPASITVSDRAVSAKQATQYADYLFERVGNGYKVLPVADRVRKPAAKGSRGTSDAAALASAQAKIAELTAKLAQQTVLPTVAADANKANGKANGKAAN